MSIRVTTGGKVIVSATGNPLDCCCDGEITLCGCTIPQTLILTVDAVTGISCPGNITVGTTCTLTWDAAWNGVGGWTGSFLAVDAEEVEFVLYCDSGTWKLRSACTGGGGAFSTTTIEAGFDCEPVNFVFLACGLSGACCGGTSGSIDVTITEPP